MGARVLVIDDHPDNLELMRYLLDAFGHQPLTATRGAAGVAATLADAPALVLCDVQLPDIDGFEVVRRLRAAGCDVPVVAVTALAMASDREAALAAGFDGYIAKPIDPTQFVAQVDGFLPPGLRSAAAAIDAPVTDSAPTSASEPGPSNGRVLLVVDNQPYNLTLATDIFGRLGYRVLTADSAELALSLARERAPDLILSDVCMPQGSGFELLVRVREDARLRDVPFVFLTSTATGEADRRRGLALGAQRYLRRPIEPEQLLREVESVLAQVRR